MKKFLAMVLALGMALSLVACGEQGDSQKGDDSASGDKVVKIGVFEPTSGQNGGGGKKEILGIEYAHSLKPTVTINGEEYSVQLVYADNASDPDFPGCVCGDRYIWFCLRDCCRPSVRER